MKMKKIFAAMAATAISASAFAAMSLSASAADVIGKADIEGQIGELQSWDMTNTVTNIDGDAQYQVVWDLEKATNTGDSNFFATVVIAPAGASDNFTTDTFSDLKVTLDEVYFDGVLQEGYDASSAVDTAYYEGSKPGTTRIYLRGDWASNPTQIIPNGLDLTSQIKVVFTVSGTGQEGTSNVTTTETPTDAPTDAPTDTPTEAPTEAPKDDAKTTTEAKKDDAKATTTKAADAAKTTAKAAANSSSEKSAQTGDNGVGLALAVVAAAGAAAFVARKKD